MIDNALQLARAGFAVFPIDGKEPLKGSRGFHDATHDEAQLRAWWTSYPHANVGIKIPPGCVVVDVDPRNGGRVEALEALGVPSTMVAASGREDGGRHYWFTVPPELSFGGRLKGLGKGYDVKMGGRGYVVAPGSIHPDTGRPYSWVSVAPTAPAPAWLLEQGWTGERNTTEARIASDLDADERTQSDEAIDRVVALVTPHYVEGQMHNVAKYLAGWLKQRGWTDADIFETVDRLPSINPRNAHDAARAAIAIPKAFGWLELQAIMGEQYAAVLDAGTTNPKREADARGVAAVSAALASVPAPQAAPPSVPTAAPRSASLLERLRARPTEQNAQVLATGIRSIDDRFDHGGIQVSKNLILGGAPDAGKTALALQIVEHMASQGAAIAWVAVDEDADDIDSRRLQSIGIPRVEASRGVGSGGLTEEHLQRVARFLEPKTFQVYESTYVDQVFAYHAQRYPEQLRVVVIDSLQTATSTNAARATAPKDRIDHLLSDIKAAQMRHPALWIATSELSRAAYRNRAQSENIDPMAAAKESGSIEYAAKVFFVLRSEGDSTVSVEIPKNKLGRKDDLRLTLDRQSLQFSPALELLADEKDRRLKEVVISVLQVSDPKDAEIKMKGLGIEAMKSRVRAAGGAFANAELRTFLDRGARDGWLEHAAKNWRLPVQRQSAAPFSLDDTLRAIGMAYPPPDVVAPPVV